MEYFSLILGNTGSKYQILFACLFVPKKSDFYLRRLSFDAKHDQPQIDGPRGKKQKNGKNGNCPAS